MFLPRRIKSRVIASVFVLAILAVSLRCVQAVVDSHSQTNTSAPADGAPWNNVGQNINGPSAVYLGNGWVITAAHVGPGNTFFGFTIYPWDNTYYVLTNSDGSFTDLVVYHLNPAPNLPTMTLTTTTPPALTQVDLIGNGLIAGSSETNFGAFTGFTWSSVGAKSWGNNRVNAGGLTTINPGAGNVTVFGMNFDQFGQTSDEAMAAPGDSGGGVFRLVSSTWQLVGVIDAITTLPSQPANTSVYGDSTYATDVATYRAQILALIGTSAHPTLSITRSGNNIQICWPQNAVGFNLESAPTLTNPTWTVIVPNVSSTNGQGCVLLPANASQSYFRLHR